MKNTGYPFEILAKDYFERKLHGEFGHHVEVHHRKKYNSGDSQYEIDLSYEFSLADLNFLVLIECKDWLSQVTRDQVINLHSKVQELNAHKGIAVSSAGFQEGAIQYALKKGIGLLKLSGSSDTEVISHFTGKDIEEIRLNLSSPESILDKVNSSEGLIVPKKDILNYISGKYGTEISSFILNCLEKMNSNKMESTELIQCIANMDQTLISLFSKIPIDWFEEYKLQESCGLNLHLTNEFGSRQINAIITAVKMFEGNDIA